MLLKILQYSQEDTKVGVSFSMKMQTLSPVTLLTKDSNTAAFLCFPVNIAKFLGTPGLKSICERLFERFTTSINNITSNI